VTVTFAPVAVTSYGGTVTVNSDKTGGTNTIAASGTGVSVPTFTISGHVRTLGGGAVPGVVLSGLPGAVTTGSDGYYTATVNTGWSGTATPSPAENACISAAVVYCEASCTASGTSIPCASRPASPAESVSPAPRK